MRSALVLSADDAAALLATLTWRPMYAELTQEHGWTYDDCEAVDHQHAHQHPHTPTARDPLAAAWKDATRMWWPHPQLAGYSSFR